MRMKITKSIKPLALLPLAIALANPSFGQTNTAKTLSSLTSNSNSVSKKKIHIPNQVFRTPAGNDYNDKNSDYSYHRMKESENIALFWHKEYGDTPKANTEDNKRFDPDDILIEAERIYNYYVNDLKLVHKGTSWSDHYKLLIYIIESEESTAFGGGSENIGMMWSSASRINKRPYGALAHELGHSFQSIATSDLGGGSRSSMVEMMAQYVLWQVYPEWLTFENYHLESLMDKTHFAFLHGTNMYHYPQVLEYWSNKHGLDFIGKIWRNGQAGEDPVTTYKRLTGLNQDQFNDEIFDAYRRFMTWDMPRVAQVAKPHINKHRTKMKKAEDGWFQIADDRVPQNYGYNGIELEVPTQAGSVEVELKGLAEAAGFTNVKVDKAGWRYGFVAVNKDGRPSYSQTFKDANGKGTFRVPPGTDRLWLVVMGAPTEHWPVVGGVGGGRRNPNVEPPKEEQWPYQIKLTGTTVVSKILQ
jgi:hypothetical protein